MRNDENSVMRIIYEIMSCNHVNYLTQVNGNIIDIVRLGNHKHTIFYSRDLTYIHGHNKNVLFEKVNIYYNSKENIVEGLTIIYEERTLV